MQKLLCAGLLIVLLNCVTSGPAEFDESNKVPRSPAIDDEDDFPSFDDEENTTEKPKSTGVIGRLGKLFNDVLQIPITVFKAVNSFISNQSFSKLRDEVRNLNISYPKSG